MPATDLTFHHRTCVEFLKLPWFTLAASNVNILSGGNDHDIGSIDLAQGHIPAMLVSSARCKMSQMLSSRLNVLGGYF